MWSLLFSLSISVPFHLSVIFSLHSFSLINSQVIEQTDPSLAPPLFIPSKSEMDIVTVTAERRIRDTLGENGRKRERRRGGGGSRKIMPLFLPKPHILIHRKKTNRNLLFSHGYLKVFLFLFIQHYIWTAYWISLMLSSEIVNIPWTDFHTEYLKHTECLFSLSTNLNVRNRL